VVVAGTPAETAALDEVLRELLAPLGVDLRLVRVELLDVRDVVTPDEAAPAAVARAWLDLHGATAAPGVRDRPAAALYLADGRWERILVRRVAIPSGIDEVAREELGHIVAAAVDGILAGTAVGVPREEVRAALGVEAAPPEGVPEPVPGSAGEPRLADLLAVDLGPTYELQGFSDAAPISHGPGLALALAQRGDGVRFGGWLTAQYRAPVVVDARPIGVELQYATLRLLAAAEIPLGARVALHLALGGGMDLVYAVPRLASGAAADVELPRFETLGVLQALLGVRVPLLGATSLLAVVGCDVEPVERSYVALLAGSRAVVLSPRIVRPLLAVRMVTDLLAGPGAAPEEEGGP
jgi:hypothetical protein